MVPPIFLRCQFRSVMALFGAALWLFASAAMADDWATRLGYEPGKKVIILHAHEMGLCHEANQAVAELIEKYPAASASAMPPCPWFAHAASYANQNKQADIGLQITLNSEWPQYRWRPISSGDMSASLIDGDGYMWRSALQVTVNARVEDVQTEMHWQLLHAQRLGMRPTHLTTHLGALYLRPDLTDAYLKFAREQWIPAVVVDLTPEMAERFASQGYPIPDSLARTLADYPLPKLKDLRIIPRTETYEEKVEATLDAIAKLPGGLCQLSIAPAVDSPALQALSTSWEQYVWDAALWQDERVQQALSAPDVVLTNWIEIMERFNPTAN
jgi:hypothetical protein